MNVMKRILFLLLALVTLLSLVSCEGEYQYATGGGGGSSGDGDGYVPPVMNDDPTDDFTVTVTADGQPYSPRMEMYVYWSDGFSVHTAKLDENGVARIDGLDGDYRVTLSAVPNEYTYNPNDNVATNDDRNIVLELYTLNRLTGSGTGLYNCYQFSKTGVYSAVINGPEDGIYFQYAPDGSGTYSIESWIDTTADNINPYIDVYGGHSQYKFYMNTTDDGGAMGSYTINFVHTVQIAKENISTGGGQAVYTFVVKAESKNNKYPITVTFAVKRDGEFELTRPGNVIATGMAIPTFDFSDFNVADHNYGSEYTKLYPEYQLSTGSNVYVFDERRFALWEKDQGGDGFYHVYDVEKYPETDGYGPILYANITTACRFIDRAFARIEYDNNGDIINAALSAGGLNYKHFIEGYTYLSTFGNINDGSYYCVSNCLCHDSRVSVKDWACTESCTKCLADCRRCPEALVGHEGYQAYVNKDGMAPVTKELKEFLEAYSAKMTFFWDGRGTLETSPTNGKYYQAAGGSGWLFACAYYEIV